MYTIKLKRFEIDAIDAIKSFELGIITNNSLQDDTLNISHYHFEQMYNILLDNFEETNNEIILGELIAFVLTLLGIASYETIKGVNNEQR